MKKILLIRFSSIGDIVLTTPVIRAVKQQLDCTLHVLTKKAFDTITGNNPHVDKVYAIHSSTKEVVEDLRNEQYDFIIDLQKNARSIRLRRKLGVPSASFPKRNIEKWMLVNLKVNRLPHMHVVDRYFMAAVPLGVRNDRKGLEYYIPDDDRVDPGKIDPQLTEGYAGIVIGGKHNTKILPVEKVIGIADALGKPVLLLGGKQDQQAGEEIVEKSKNQRVFNACGKFNLNQSASLVQQARVIITNDTGLMHIAAAFDKPVITIWGNTVPAFGMYPYMPQSENHYISSEVQGLRCRPCSKLGYSKCPKGHFKCMMQQDVGFIVEHALRFLR